MRSSQDGITYFLLPLLFLFIFGEHIQTAWEWGESKIHQLTQTPEEQMLEEIAKSRKTLPEIRKEAEEGSASALATMGDRYDRGQGVPRSDEIAVQYYLKAYEAAVEAAVGEDKWDEWLSKPADAWPSAASGRLCAGTLLRAPGRCSRGMAPASKTIPASDTSRCALCPMSRARRSASSRARRSPHADTSATWGRAGNGGYPPNAQRSAEPLCGSAQSCKKRFLPATGT